MHAETNSTTGGRWRVALAWGERAAAIGLSVVLLRSAFAHIGNPYHFLSSVYSYQVVGYEVGRFGSAVLPFLELALAVCLLSRWWAREAYVVAAVMFVGFVAAQGWTLHRGLDISCGCFGATDSDRVGWRTLILAGSAAVVAVAGGCVSFRREAHATT
jgi:hypothetical protein